jgi:hypothetical protein
VSHIYSTDEQKGNADKHKVAIVQKSARIPGNNENAESDNNTKYFSKAMEKEIIIQAGKI